MPCRSLGLTLLEAATGRYPYDAAGGPLQLMIQVIMHVLLKRLKTGKMRMCLQALLCSGYRLRGKLSACCIDGTRSLQNNKS